MPDSSPLPAAPASYGSRDAVPAHTPSAVNRPQKRQVRLPHAEDDLNFAAPLQHQSWQRRRKIQEIPANADVAQLVEHFTRNEGVPGSSPGVGFYDMPAIEHVLQRYVTVVSALFSRWSTQRSTQPRPPRSTREPPIPGPPVDGVGRGHARARRRVPRPARELSAAAPGLTLRRSIRGKRHEACSAK